MTAGAARTADPPGLPLVVRRSLRVRARDKAGAVALVLPGVAWLAVFFLVPLLIILIFSLGTKDAAGHVVLDHLGLQNYAQATRPEYLPAFANSLRYAVITTILQDPTVNPDIALLDKLVELLDLGADLDKYTQRWNALKA